MVIGVGGRAMRASEDYIWEYVRMRVPVDVSRGKARMCNPVFARRWQGLDRLFLLYWRHDLGSVPAQMGGYRVVDN